MGAYTTLPLTMRHSAFLMASLGSAAVAESRISTGARRRLMTFIAPTMAARYGLGSTPGFTITAVLGSDAISFASRNGFSVSMMDCFVCGGTHQEQRWQQRHGANVEVREQHLVTQVEPAPNCAQVAAPRKMERNTKRREGRW